MRRLFLIGVLCGVALAAAFTFVLAIPANNYHWQTEIWNRGGGTWTFDKDGRWDWKWTIDPIRDVPPQKRIIAPPVAVKVHAEQL